MERNRGGGMFSKGRILRRRGGGQRFQDRSVASFWVCFILFKDVAQSDVSFVQGKCFRF